MSERACYVVYICYIHVRRSKRVIMRTVSQDNAFTWHVLPSLVQALSTGGSKSACRCASA